MHQMMLGAILRKVNYALSAHGNHVKLEKGNEILVGACIWTHHLLIDVR